MIRGRVTMICRALSPIHHGAEVVGNVSTFRKHDVYVDGSAYSVPYISGNSVKSANRRASAQFAVTAMELEGTMTRAEVALLRSGGAMTKSGPVVRLDKARDASRSMPVLGLHGFAAGNAMQESMVSVDILEPLCWETREKYRREVEAYLTAADHWALEEPASEFLRTYSEYARDGSRDRGGFKLMTPDDAKALADQLAKSEDKDPYRPMPHSFECLKPGTILLGGWTFAKGITDEEMQAWRAGVTFACEGVAADGGLLMRLGGKTARGFGKVSVHLFGELARGIEAPQFLSTPELVPGAFPDDALREFGQSLASSKDDAQRAMREVAS